LFALLAAGGRRVRGFLAKEYDGASHIRDFIAPGAKTDAYPGAKYRSSTMAAPRRMQREAAARRQALRAARDPTAIVGLINNRMADAPAIPPPANWPMSAPISTELPA
jgi:hypothetical protein